MCTEKDSRIIQDSDETSGFSADYKDKKSKEIGEAMFDNMMDAVTIHRSGASSGQYYSVADVKELCDKYGKIVVDKFAEIPNKCSEKLASISDPAMRVECVKKVFEDAGNEMQKEAKDLISLVSVRTSTFRDGTIVKVSSPADIHE